MRIREKRAIVTGASSGIGRATAIELARRGCDLVISSRRESALEVVAEECRKLGVTCVVAIADVSRQTDCEDLVKEAIRALGSVDILVNNAGFGVFEPVESIDLEPIVQMSSTNYLGMVHCTKAALPHMLERGSGAIVNVSSITGIMGSAGMGAYGATKAAIITFSEALRDEVIDRGVFVSVVCPGTTSTNLFEIGDARNIPAASALIPSMSAEKVAKAVRRAVERGSYRIILPWQAAVFMRFKEMFPRTAHWMMRTTSRMLEGRIR